MSVLLGTEYTLTSPTFVGADGETPQDCASDPTATVARADGTALDPATVTDLASNGIYTAALTTDHTDQLDVLTVTWTGTADLLQVYKQLVEVAGGWYVTVPEVRAEPDLSVVNKYPTAAIRRHRDRFESLAEDRCGTAFVPRYASAELRGTGTSHLFLPHPHVRAIRSVTIGGEAQDVDDYEPDDVYGLVRTDGSTFAYPTSSEKNVIVAYEHGYDCPPPELKEACLEYIRTKLIGKRAGYPPTGDGEVPDGFAVANATRDRPTGIASVDAVLAALDETIPGIA